MWTCSKCATKVDPSFEVCWSCGTTVDGIEDPSFVPADEMVVDGSPTDSDQAIVATSGDELVECYAALDLMQAKFLSDQLTEAGIPATHDGQDMHDQLGLMNATPKVRVLAKDLARARDWLATYEQTIHDDAANRSS